MKTKKFIVLYANEDGEHFLNYKTAKEIKGEYLKGDNPTSVLTELPYNLGYCSGILIIDGTIIVPKVKKVIKDWDIS